MKDCWAYDMEEEVTLAIAALAKRVFEQPWLILMFAANLLCFNRTRMICSTQVNTTGAKAWFIMELVRAGEKNLTIAEMTGKRYQFGWHRNIASYCLQAELYKCSF